MKMNVTKIVDSLGCWYISRALMAALIKAPLDRRRPSTSRLLGMALHAQFKLKSGTPVPGTATRINHVHGSGRSRRRRLTVHINHFGCFRVEQNREDSASVERGCFDTTCLQFGSEPLTKAGRHSHGSCVTHGTTATQRQASQPTTPPSPFATRLFFLNPSFQTFKYKNQILISRKL